MVDEFTATQPPSGLRDRMGRDLAVGDVVVPLTAMVPVFQITEIRPNLAMNAPKNTLVLTLLVMQRVVVPVGGQLQDMLLVKRAPEVLEHGGGETPPAAPGIKLVE